MGCGTGQIAKKLLDMGYQVDCVSPCPFLKKQASELLGDKSCVFECSYENLQTVNRYDMVLFCESFQYIDMEQALSKTDKFLKSGGYLLICDIFRKDTPDKTFMGGGHSLTRFYNLIAKSSFRLTENVDITEQTAPNMDLLDDVMESVVRPVVSAGVRFLESRSPIMLKLLRWKYRKKINRAHKKYLEGRKTGENFKKYKSYQLFLYKRDAQVSSR